MAQEIDTKTVWCGLCLKPYIVNISVNNKFICYNCVNIIDLINNNIFDENYVYPDLIVQTTYIIKNRSNYLKYEGQLVIKLPLLKLCTYGDIENGNEIKYNPFSHDNNNFVKYYEYFKHNDINYIYILDNMKVYKKIPQFPDNSALHAEYFPKLI